MPRRRAKRAVCFWCHQPILWSTWHYHWFDQNRSTACPAKPGGLHLAVELDAAPEPASAVPA